MKNDSSRRFRPRMERLEDREVPALFTAASVSDLIADIDAANLTAEADTITLVAGRTFTLTGVNNTAHGSTGLPVIAATENLTIVGNGDIIERRTTGGTPAFRLFDVAAGATLTLENLTLQGGLALDYGGSAQGGAIYSQGALTLESVTVQNNTAQGSSGYLLQFSGFNMPGGSALGGGLYSNGTLTMAACTIQKNAAIGGQGADSTYVSVPNDPHPFAQYVPASDGGIANGGGLYVGGGVVTITSSSITSNSAQGGAGGQREGHKGQGVGGGIYIAPAATVGLDAFTVDHVKHNRASTSDPNIYGSYDVIL
jgi:hypothetical protein